MEMIASISENWSALKKYVASGVRSNFELALDN
jgi:hypothetical protein